MAAVVAAGVFCAAGVAVASGTAAGGRGLTIFTVATGAQFINTEDDRARGASNNPFDASANKLRPKVNDVGDGPFPGDVAVYNFDLYMNKALKKSVGTASYTCYFNYGKRALCQAYYELPGGTVTAAGPVDFNKTSFTLVITGGTKKYLADRGQMGSVQAGSKAQRVDFKLLG